jgi:hypothetical protein
MKDIGQFDLGTLFFQYNQQWVFGSWCVSHLYLGVVINDASSLVAPLFVQNKHSVIVASPYSGDSSKVPY